MIAKIKIGQQRLGWDDIVYRKVLTDLCGVDSLTKLENHQLPVVLNHMKDCGFQPTKRHKKKPQRRSAEGLLAKKIRALWISLYHLAEIGDSSEEALLSFAQRVTKTDTADGTGVQALQWLTAKQAYQVIEALKARAKRAGVNWNHPYGERAAIVVAQWHSINALGAHRPRIGEFNEVIREATGKRSLATTNENEQDALIRVLGKRLREVKA